MSSPIQSFPITGLTGDTEFVLFDKVEDPRGNLEIRLTFYKKIRQIDEKKVEVILYGCTQTAIYAEENGMSRDERVNAFKVGKLLLKPRYNNLDHRHTNPAPMPGAYVPCLSGAQASLMRIFYRDYRAKVPTALAMIPEDE